MPESRGEKAKGPGQGKTLRASKAPAPYRKRARKSLRSGDVGPGLFEGTPGPHPEMRSIIDIRRRNNGR